MFVGIAGIACESSVGFVVYNSIVYNTIVGHQVLLRTCVCVYGSTCLYVSNLAHSSLLEALSFLS